MTASRVAILVHVFYERLWPELEMCISNFIAVCGRENVGVYITYPETKPHIAEMLADFPARKYCVPNKGWDVWPFFHALADVDLDAYDYVLKLHTKDNPTDGWMNFRTWKKGEHRTALLSICSTRRAVRRSLKAMARDKTIGMIAARSVIDPSGIAAGDATLSRSGDLLASYGIAMKGSTVVYGTMFMIRAALLKPVKGKVSINDFEEAVSIPGKPHAVGLAGTWEMTFALLAESQGFRVAQGSFPRFMSVAGYWLKARWFRFLRILSRMVGKLASL